MDAFHMNFFELDILTANIFTKFFGLKHLLLPCQTAISNSSKTKTASYTLSANNVNFPQINIPLQDIELCAKKNNYLWQIRHNFFKKAFAMKQVALVAKDNFYFHVYQSWVSLWINWFLLFQTKTFVMFWAIWYHLYNLKNVKNTHGHNFTKSNTSPWVFLTFFKLYKWYQIAQRIIFTFTCLKCHVLNYHYYQIYRY